MFSLLHTSEAGQLPEVQSRFYTACVGLAIKHIHSMGFLYCDIKLENVLITSDGYVKLCDFGLAKKLGPARTRFLPFCNGEPRSYSKCGTDQYAPPEVVNGSGRAKGADWWALGVLLHEMLTGHSPFEGKGMAEIFAAVEEYANGGDAARVQLRTEVLEVRAHTHTHTTSRCAHRRAPPWLGRGRSDAAMQMWTVSARVLHVLMWWPRTHPCRFAHRTRRTCRTRVPTFCSTCCTPSSVRASVAAVAGSPLLCRRTRGTCRSIGSRCSVISWPRRGCRRR